MDLCGDGDSAYTLRDSRRRLTDEPGKERLLHPAKGSLCRFSPMEVNQMAYAAKPCL
jgi:hypothetical protein